MQSCWICQKFTDTVLFNETGPDWIYTCDLHLMDNPQFVTPTYPAKYYEAVTEVKRCQLQLSQFKDKQLHSSSWDGWITAIFNKKRGKEDTPTGETTPPLPPPVALLEAAQGSDTPDPKKLERGLQMEYDSALETMTTLQSQNKTYKLSDKMFEYRIQIRRKQQLQLQQRKRQEEQAKREAQSYTTTDPAELAEKFNFPSVPQNKLK